MSNATLLRRFLGINSNMMGAGRSVGVRKLTPTSCCMQSPIVFNSNHSAWRHKKPVPEQERVEEIEDGFFRCEALLPILFRRTF